jgi:CHAT domain-containing protein/tetratricopeptide (TPR) repeat protein
LGEPRKALTLCERALAMRDRLYPKQDHPDLATSLDSLGILLDVLGEPRKALPFHERALAMCERLYPQQDHPDLATRLNNIGYLLEKLRDLRKALPFHERALAMRERLYPQQDHRDLAQSLHNMGHLLQALGEPRKALPFYERALAMCERLYPQQDHRDLAVCLSNMGYLLMALGEPRKALPLCERALAIDRRHIDDLAASAPEAHALAFAGSLHPTCYLLLSLTRHIDNADADTYGHVWDAKAAVTHVLERRHLAARAARDKKTNDTWLALGDKRRELARLLLTPVPTDEEARNARDKAVNRVTDQKEQLESDLLELFPDLKEKTERDRLGPDELAKRFPDGTAFLDFVRYFAFDTDPQKRGKDGVNGTWSYAVFVLAKGKTLKRVELGLAEPIDGAVTAWRRAIDDWRPDLAPAARKDLAAQADRHAADLRRLVWGPIAAHVPAGTTTLYLSPDGDLARLPWAALPGDRAGKVLLDDYRLALVPHGPFLLARLLAPPTRDDATGRLLAVGGVTYDPAGSAAKGVPYNFLKGSADEVKQALALAGKRPHKALEGADATTSAVLKELRDARYAHLATHAFFNEDLLTEERQRIADQMKRWQYDPRQVTERVGVGVRSPLAYTGLVLAGANAPDKAGPDGGIATGEALVELPLEGLRLCVLSACETGLGELTADEGVRGLVRAFHLAGCPDVVASLWKVHDRATAALMAKFYHELWVNKKAPIDALREAQLLVMRRPDLVGDLAGERGVARQEKAVQVNTSEAPPKELLAGERLPPKLWAAFHLSGSGR